MKSILIDSDIIIDVLAYREPFVNDSKKIIEMCELNEIHGYTTPVILANVYYLMQKRLSDSLCRSIIKNLLNTIDVLQIGKPQILQALDSNFKDFEDALQNYSAVASGKIDIIITRNIKDYKHSQLAIMTPELFVKSYL